MPRATNTVAMTAPASSVSQPGHAAGNRPAANKGHAETPASIAATVKHADGGYVRLAPGAPPTVLTRLSSPEHGQCDPSPQVACSTAIAASTAHKTMAKAVIMTGTAACTASRGA